MGRPTTLKERNNVECPQCGSVLTRGRGGGRSADEHRVRRRRCDDCGTLFCTVEVALFYKDGTLVPFGALVPSYLEANRRTQRARVGYHETASGRPPYVVPARLRVRVSVQPPVRDENPGPWASSVNTGTLGH